MLRTDRVKDDQHANVMYSATDRQHNTASRRHGAIGQPHCGARRGAEPTPTFLTSSASQHEVEGLSAR